MSAYRIEITEIRRVPQTDVIWRKVTDEPGRNQYDYVPAAPGATQEHDTKVYEQTVEELDLQKVILAVNGIGREQLP